MKKYYQKPQLELISLDMEETITFSDDSDVGLESNPWLQYVYEDELQLLQEELEIAAQLEE